MRLGVGHGLHSRQAVGHHRPHLPYVPLLVGNLLELFDPVVGDGHAQPVVEPDAAVVDGDAHARHAAHVLGDRHGRGAEVVDEAVGQRQVVHGVFVHPLVEVAVAAVEVDIAVVAVEHRRHPVEAEAVEGELVEPVFDVREQEVLHFALAVVEEFRIPVGLVARLARGRVEVVRAVQLVDPLVEVLHVVGVHEIHDDGQSQLVRPAHQLFQLLGRAEARRGGEETRNVVAERPVVGVLGDGHELHGVVAAAFDDREDSFSEFAVGPHSLALLRHAHVGLVDQQAACRRGLERIAAPVEGGVRFPELRREILRLLVLHHAPGVGRDAVPPAVVTVDVELVERAVEQPVAVHRRGEEGAPDPRRVAVHPDLGALPAVEVPEHIDVRRTGQPFAEPPPLQSGIPLPAEIAVAVGVIDDRPRGAFDGREFVEVTSVAAGDRRGRGTEPFVAEDDRQQVGVFSHRTCGFIQIYEKFFYLCLRTLLNP